MPELFSELVSALRTEMQEYGALLRLIEVQQECILRHDPKGYLDINVQVDEQIDLLTRCRVEREALVRLTAKETGLLEEATLAALTSDCPSELRPLLCAQVEEINSLAVFTKKRIRQNCELLARCLKTAREIVGVVDAGALSETYSASGQVSDRVHAERFTAALA